MNQKDFMSQSVDDISIKELVEAIKIKIKEDSTEARVPMKDPNVFEDESRKIIIRKNGGGIDIKCKIIGTSIYFESSLPLLEKAVARAKELRGGK